MKKEMWWLIVSLYLFLFVGGSSTDWTTTCPTGCICRWVGGKKAAECREGGFTSIPVGLSDEVQVLDLRGNSITSLRQYVFRDAGLINLNKIKMTHCGIERVDRYAFAELKILIELDLSDNRIQELTMESFETNARLRELQLSDNPLMQLLGIGFPPLLYFQKLSLRNCNLSSIPPRAFEQLTTLEQLDLSGNQFQTLTIDPFAHLQKLKSLALHDNPWKCDCRLKSFRDWTLMNNLLTVQPSTRCTQPEVFAKFEWSHLQTTHFTCSPEILALQISGQATDAYIVGDVGKTITLECLVKGNPPPDVRWVKDTVSMTNGTASAAGKNYYVQVSGDLERWVNLTLTNTHLGDAGEYTCVGENSGGSVERNITLNFEDVPSGAGVGMGMGSEGGTLHGTSWLWILIGSVGALLMIFMLLGLIFCLCTRKPRKDHRTEMKGLPLQEGVTAGEDTLDQGSNVNGQLKDSAEPLLSPTSSRPEKSEDPDYPDLLDLPVGVKGRASPVGSIVSRSTVPDTTRLVYSNQPLYYRPQELDPSALYYDPSRNPSLYSNPYMGPYGNPHSPFSGSVASFGGSELPKAIIPPPHRRGYVTLPRRPRVPSWSPATPMTPHSISPTGSTTMLLGSPNAKYDNLGIRRTADGSSRQNLNELDSYPNTPQSYSSSTLPSHPRSRMNGSARLNGSHSTPNPYHPPVPTYFNFDPIQENEGSGESSNNFGLPTETPTPANPSSEDGKSTPSGRKVAPKPPPKPKKLNLDSPLPNKETTVEMPGEEGTEV